MSETFVWRVKYAGDGDVERSEDRRIEASVEAVTSDQWHQGPEITPVSQWSLNRGLGIVNTCDCDMDYLDEPIFESPVQIFVL